MDSQTSTLQRGPEYFAKLAERFGHAPKIVISSNDFHLHHYEVVPGGWRHEPLDYCRIAVQQVGSPRMVRAIDGRSERQLRPAGHISVSPSATSQSWSWDQKMQMSLLFVANHILEELSVEAGIPLDIGMRTPLAEDDKLIRSSVAHLIEEHSRGFGVPQLLIGAAGRHIAAHLLFAYSPERDVDLTGRMADWQLKRAIEFIHSHACEDIGLAELASSTGLPPHYFCRIFRKTVGIPPYRYLLNCRMEAAKRLLVTSDLAVTAIALEVGFSSHAHFSTAFKRLVGQTPAAYRKEVSPNVVLPS
jgi:AraC family transcriptional regulator